MKSFIEFLQEDELNIPCEISNEKIRDAEKELSLRFADEYCEYVKAYGIAIADGHEFTGICDSRRLNVVCVTLYEKSIDWHIPSDWYVVEQANIDGIVVWQNQEGVIYQTAPNVRPQKICNSLAEYMRLGSDGDGT